MKITSQINLQCNVTATVRDAVTGEIKQVVKAHNKIPTVGLTAIISHLTEASPTPSALLIRYCEVGTGTNVPASGDTTLQTSTGRTSLASISPSGTTAYITGFFNTSEGNGTLREAGLFIGGTTVAGTGTLISRVAISITKTVADTLTLDWTITASSLT